MISKSQPSCAARLTITLPAFLRKRDQIIDHQDPRYWARSEHYEGLTPLGVSEWLRITRIPMAIDLCVPAADGPGRWAGGLA